MGDDLQLSAICGEWPGVTKSERTFTSSEENRCFIASCKHRLPNGKD